MSPLNCLLLLYHPDSFPVINFPLQPICYNKGMEKNTVHKRKLHREEVLGLPPEIEVEEFPKAVLEYFDKYKRDLPWRREPTPYHVWVSEIMLQQTRVEAVIPYYERFLEKYPSTGELAEATEDELHKIWEGLGYYNRVMNMKKAAEIIVSDLNGELPNSYEELIKLPGIGPYTGAAIASMAYGEPVPAMDGNLYRIMSRILGEDRLITRRPAQKFLGEETFLRMDQDRPGEFNQGMMDIGATICIPNGAPKCNICPLEKFCYAAAEGNPTDYPVKPKKKDRKVEERTVLILIKNGEVALRKRPKKGLLAGLWELPSLSGYYTEEDIRTYLEGKMMPIASVRRAPDSKHIFSHVEWHMKGYYVKIKDIPMAREENTYTWADKRELEEKYALPSAFETYRNALFNIERSYL